MEASQAHDEKLTWLECTVLVLSVYVLIVVFLETVLPLSQTTIQLLDYIDSAICFLFLYDFFYRLWKAPSKRAFLRWGWLDFISSIPMLGIFRWARIARVVRILRLIRAFRSSKVLISYLFRHRARSTLATVSLISVILVILSAVAIMHAEVGAASNIRTPSDAIWWAFSTITTVGYGDRYPITPEGRMIAVLLMIAGVGLFATFTGFISSFFLNSGAVENPELKTLIAEVKHLRTEIESLRQSRTQTAPQLSPEPAALSVEVNSTRQNHLNCSG